MAVATGDMGLPALPETPITNRQQSLAFRMGANKASRLAHKSALRQRDVLADFQSLAKSVERGEKMIFELKDELEEVNRHHQNRQTTREDIAYLEDLLRCAKKKLAWEKLMESLSRRTPEALAKVSTVMNDPKNPPDDDVKQALVDSLQTVQAAMVSLEAAKVG